MQKITASKLMSATKPFFVVRALVYLVITLIMLAVGIFGSMLSIWLMLRAHIFGYIFFLVVVIGLIGFLRFAKRYVLYLIKAAHVAAITEFLKTGQVPVTVKGYKGVLAYGTEKVKNNFGATNVAFVADALIAGATRQIMRWLNKVQNLLTFIPGAQSVFNFLNYVLSTALNFIDEAVLSYVFWHSGEKSGFQKACEGIVYYAQSWKSMLKGALKVGLFVWALRIVTFVVFYLMILSIGSTIFTTGGFLMALFLGFVIVYGIENILVDPFATCIMVNDFHKAIEGQPLKADLYGTLCKVSKKFRELFNKSGQPEGFGDETSFGDAPGAYPQAAYAAAPYGQAGGAHAGVDFSAPRSHVSEPSAQGNYAPMGSGEQAKRFCSNCGSKVAAGTNFCAACGAQVQ